LLRPGRISKFAGLNSSNRFACKHSVPQFRINEPLQRVRDQQKLDAAKAFFVDGCLRAQPAWQAQYAKDTTW
jgi:hypothetical protein